VKNYGEKIRWKIAVKKYSEKSRWKNTVKNHGEKLVWKSTVKNNGEKFRRKLLVTNAVENSVQKFLDKFPCKIIPEHPSLNRSLVIWPTYEGSSVHIYHYWKISCFWSGFWNKNIQIETVFGMVSSITIWSFWGSIFYEGHKYIEKIPKLEIMIENCIYFKNISFISLGIRKLESMQLFWK